MSGFQRENATTLRIELNEIEQRLLTDLAQQLIGVLDAATDRATSVADPAIQRLLPDAYPGDEEASAEFRRFTADGLADKKKANARMVIASLEAATGDPAPVRVGADEAQAWLRALTSIRITLATRLGIERDGDDGRTDEEAMPMQQVYFWLGFLLESLLEAL